MQGQLNSVVPNYGSSEYVQSRERRIKQYQYKLRSDESQMRHQMEYIDLAIFVFLGSYTGQLFQQGLVEGELQTQGILLMALFRNKTGNL